MYRALAIIAVLGGLVMLATGVGAFASLGEISGDEQAQLRELQIYTGVALVSGGLGLVALGVAVVARLRS